MHGTQMSIIMWGFGLCNMAVSLRLWGFLPYVAVFAQRKSHILLSAIPLHGSIQLYVRLCSTHCHQTRQIGENAFGI